MSALDRTITLRDDSALGRTGGISNGGEFEIYKDERGEYRFRLRAGNGEIVATGESYKTKAAVKAGIGSITGRIPRRRPASQNVGTASLWSRNMRIDRQQFRSGNARR